MYLENVPRRLIVEWMNVDERCFRSSRGRVVKASDQKSDSLWERRFESYRLRLRPSKPNFFSTCIPDNNFIILLSSIFPKSSHPESSNQNSFFKKQLPSPSFNPSPIHNYPINSPSKRKRKPQKIRHETIILPQEPFKRIITFFLLLPFQNSSPTKILFSKRRTLQPSFVPNFFRIR